MKVSQGRENIEMLIRACAFILPGCFPKIQNYRRIQLKKKMEKGKTYKNTLTNSSDPPAMVKVTVAGDGFMLNLSHIV